MVIALGSPQPVYTLPPLADIFDGLEDRPQQGPAIGELGPLALPNLILGAAAFSGQYNSDSHLASDTPLRTVRLALRYGINAIDTSTYYGPSEIILGQALKALEPDYPRSSYKLMTKCGRYGLTQAGFDYSPATIRASVNRSLSRLNTTYLDTVYLHDVEFVCTKVQPREAGNHLSALHEDVRTYGLSDGDCAKICGEGDQRVLDAILELRKLKAEGLVRNIGISGYPLPVLLRIAILALNTPPFEPLDVLLSYSHLNLQNDTFLDFLPHLRERAGVSQFVVASPMNMGLLTATPPAWHPAPQRLREAAQVARETCTEQGWEGGFPNVALGFAYRKSRELGLPTVVGLSHPREVHETVEVWRELKEASGERVGKRAMIENTVRDVFGEYQGYSWPSP